MIVVVDDEDRENEGDLTMAAEMVTPEAINFMATHGRGLICLAMTGERLDELDLAPMAPDNTALRGTAFTVSIDVKGPASRPAFRPTIGRKRSGPPWTPAALRKTSPGRDTSSRCVPALAACWSAGDRPRQPSILPASRGCTPRA